MKLMQTILQAITNFSIKDSEANQTNKLENLSVTKPFIALTLAFALVACGGGGGGGGASDAATPALAVFSHSGYTFAPRISGDDMVPETGAQVGQVFTNPVAISELVAAEVADSSATEITPNDYNISYRITDDDISSPVNTFFRVDASTGQINVSSPAGISLTFDQIRGFLTGNTLGITMAISPANNLVDFDEITRNTNVVVLNNEDRIAAGLDGSKPFLSYDPESVTSPSGAGVMANFITSGSVNENNRLSSPLDFARLNNPKPANPTSSPTTAFDISRIKAEPDAPEVTLFYAVVNNSVTGSFEKSNPTCGDGAVYLDNNDMRLKAGKRFDYEDPTNPNKVYNCRLAVSTDGLEYRPLAFFIYDLPAANVTATSEQATAHTSSNSIYRVNQETATANDFDCSTSSCYYGDITININDINERPTIVLNGGATAFTAIPEGLGAMEKFATFTGTPLNDASLSENDAVNDVTLIIDDLDAGQDVGDITISVRPSHGEGAFRIDPSGNDNEYNLVIVDKSKLDYEAFRGSPAIYELTISAEDGATVDKLSPASTPFNLPITDVAYNPVFVNASSGDPIDPDAAFIPESNIERGPNGSPLYLLSHSLAFHRSPIGSFAAVDPETGEGSVNGNNLIYSINTSNPPNVLERNLDVTSTKSGGNLIVTGTGLRDTDSATTLTLRVDNPVHAGSAITSVVLQVNSDEYEAILGDLSAPSIFFNPDIDLVGDFAEGPYAAAANTPVTFGRAVPIDNMPAFNEFTAANRAITDNNDDLAPGFGFMDAASFNRIPNALRRNLEQGGLNKFADKNIFSIDASTGEISIKPTANVDFPAFYEFAIFVTPTAADAAPAYSFGASDIAIVTAFATDTNEPPVATTTNNLNLDSENPLTGSIAENLNAGTSIVSFRVTDDNIQLPNGAPTFSFTGNNVVTANELLEITTSLSGDALTATLRTKVQLDYENSTHEAALSDLNIMVTDAGQYTSFNSATGEVTQGDANAIATGTSPQTLTFPVAITLGNVINEQAVLAAAAGPLSISESATGIAGTPPTIFARVTNTRDFPNADSTGFDPSRIALSLTGDFAGILVPEFSSANDGSIVLRVVDPARLENLGDGRTFRTTIIAKVPGAADGRITIPIQITNDEDNSEINQATIDDIAERLRALSINEQDVTTSNGRAYVLNLTVDTNTLIVDADDKLFGQPLVPDLGISVVSASFATATSLNPTIDATSILSFDDNNGVFTLQIDDADFIEDALFGDITVNLKLTAAGESYSIPSTTIPINPAAPKNIVYSVTPPVYALSYAQTDYLEEGMGETNLTKLTEGGVTSIDILDKPTGLDLGSSINGVANSYINITNDNTPGAHSTVSLRGAGLGRNKRFIARQNADANLVEAGPNADIDPINSRSILITIADNAVALPETAANFDILSPDAENNLVNARSEFERYFDLQVNTATRQLNITQRVFTYTDDAGTPDDQSDDSEVNYNALDTLQLYAGAQGKHTFNYFIRAKTADADSSNSDASNYALAQFSIEVEAPGLSEPPQLGAVSVTRASLPEDTPLNTAVATVIISEDDLDRDIAERGGLNNVYIASIVTTRTQADANDDRRGQVEPDILSVTLDDPTAGDNQLTANIVSASAYTDAQVGEYTAVLSVEDTAAAAIVRSNEFTFNVTRINDATENVIINFINDNDTAGYDRLNININDYDNDGDGLNSLELSDSNFTLEFMATDDDLLEPQTTFNAATYSSVDFTINQPGVASDTTCTYDSHSSILDGASIRDEQNGNSVDRSGYLAAGNDPLELFNIVSYSTSNERATGPCADLRIGSTITGATFNGVSVIIPEGDTTTMEEIRANTATNAPAFPAYTFRGHRLETPTMAVSSNNLALSPGANADLVVTLTDRDSDDGYFNNYDSPNIVRDPANEGEWQFVTLTLGTGCTGLDSGDISHDSAFSSVNNVESTATATATQKVNIVGTDFTAGECTLTISSAGEDGVATNSETVTIRAKVASGVVASTAPVIAPDAITYGTGGGAGTALSLDYTFTVTDGDADSNEITYNYTIADTSSEVCQLPTTSSTISPTAAGSGDRGSAISITTPLSIVPIKPGDCLVQITATEDGLPSEINDAATFTVILPELAPTNTPIANAGDTTPIDLNNLQVEIDGALAYQTTLGSSDNDDGAIEVRASTNDASICTVALTSTATTTGIGTEASPLNLPSSGGELSITINGVVAGNCQISLWAIEDGARNDLLTNLAVTVTEISVAPSVVAGTTPVIAPDAITYGTGGGTGTAISLDYTFTVTDGDADSNEITYNYTIADSSDEVCELPTTSSTISPTAAGSEDRGSAISVTASLSIVPIKPGECLVQITATEDGDTSEINDAATFTVILPELAPGLSFSGMPQLFSGESGVISIVYNDGVADFEWSGRAVETDNDRENPTISVETSDNCSGGVLATPVFNTNGGTVSVNIHAISPGTCEGNITATEDGVPSTAQTFNITLPELAPTNTPLTNALGGSIDLTNVTIGEGQSRTYKTTLGSIDNDNGVIEVSASTNDANICTVALTSTATTTGTGTEASPLNLPSTGGELRITITGVGADSCEVSLWAIEDGARNDILTDLPVTIITPVDASPLEIELLQDAVAPTYYGEGLTFIIEVTGGNLSAPLTGTYRVDKLFPFHEPHLSCGGDLPATNANNDPVDLNNIRRNTPIRIHISDDYYKSFGGIGGGSEFPPGDGACQISVRITDGNSTATEILTNKFDFNDFPPVLGLGNSFGDDGDVPQSVPVNQRAEIYVNATNADRYSADDEAVTWRIRTATAGCDVSLEPNFKLTQNNYAYDGHSGELSRDSYPGLLTPAASSETISGADPRSATNRGDDQHTAGTGGLVFVNVTDGLAKTCVVTIEAEEDGEVGSATFEVPFVDIQITSNADDFNFGDYTAPSTYTIAVGQNVRGNNGAITLSAAPTNTSMCSITLNSDDATEGRGTNTLTLPAAGSDEVTVSVTPLNVGECEIGFTATDGASAPPQFDTVTLPNLPPDTSIVASTVDEVNDFGNGAITATYTETVEYEAIITKRDPDNSKVTIGEFVSRSSACKNIELPTEPLTYTGEATGPGNVGKTVRLTYKARYTGPTPTTSAEECVYYVIATEDGQVEGAAAGGAAAVVVDWQPESDPAP